MFTHAELWGAIDSLANSRRWTASGLSTRAGLDPTALNRSKRLGREGKPRWPSTGTIQRLLTVTGLSLRAFGELIENQHQRMAASTGEIVFVDDDAPFCASAGSALRAAGYKVHVCHDHRNALDIIEQQHVDLLCTDIVMPEGLGGVALARRALAWQPGLKVLYLTGFDIPGLKDGPIRVVRKPLGGNALLHEVAGLLALNVQPNPVLPDQP